MNDVAVAHPAATVVVARAIADDGFEVFLVKRNGRAGFMANAHVFPGGRVDDDDNAFGKDSFAIAAIRETWEETGVLLARPESGIALSTLDPINALSARIAGGMTFSEAMNATGLVPDVEQLTPIAWWITPAAEPRRFDTRFFFAVVPPLQRHTAVADGNEVVEGDWFTPQQALDAYAAGTINLSPPTLVTLEELAPLSLSAVRTQTWSTRAVQPVFHEHDDGIVLALPGDALHDEREAIWPTRTRIVAGKGQRWTSTKA